MHIKKFLQLCPKVVLPLSSSMQHLGEPKSFPWVGTDCEIHDTQLSELSTWPRAPLFHPTGTNPGAVPSPGHVPEDELGVPSIYPLKKYVSTSRSAFSLGFVLVPFNCPPFSPSSQGLCSSPFPLISQSESTLLSAREYICFKPCECCWVLQNVR